MEAKKSQTVKEFYKSLIGQTVTVHLIGGETMNGIVLDVDAGDVLIRRTGDQDLALISAGGFSAITAGTASRDAAAE